jgi:hypothetical protein
MAGKNLSNTLVMKKLETVSMINSIMDIVSLFCSLFAFSPSSVWEFTMLKKLK